MRNEKDNLRPSPLLPPLPGYLLTILTHRPPPPRHSHPPPPQTQNSVPPRPCRPFLLPRHTDSVGTPRTPRRFRGGGSVDMMEGRGESEKKGIGEWEGRERRRVSRSGGEVSCCVGRGDGRGKREGIGQRNGDSPLPPISPPSSPHNQQRLRPPRQVIPLKTNLRTCCRFYSRRCCCCCSWCDVGCGGGRRNGRRGDEGALDEPDAVTETDLTESRGASRT